MTDEDVKVKPTKCKQIKVPAPCPWCNGEAAIGRTKLKIWVQCENGHTNKDAELYLVGFIATLTPEVQDSHIVDRWNIRATPKQPQKEAVTTHDELVEVLEEIVYSGSLDGVIPHTLLDKCKQVLIKATKEKEFKKGDLVYFINQHDSTKRHYKVIDKVEGDKVWFAEGGWLNKHSVFHEDEQAELLLLIDQRACLDFDEYGWDLYDRVMNKIKQ